MYAYDGADRVLSITYPDDEDIIFEYYDSGMVKQRTDQRGIVTTYEYNKTGQMLNKSAAIGSDDYDEDFTYDGLGRMKTAYKIKDKTEGGQVIVSEIDLSYYESGPVYTYAQKLFGGNDRPLWYSYDQAGYVTNMEYFNNDDVEIEPDWRGRIGTIGLEGTTVAEYEYIGSRVAKRTYSSMSSPVYYRAEYDNLGRLENAKTNFTEFGYQYVADTDNIWKRTHGHRSGSPQDVYAYDDLDRLAGVTHHDSTDEAFPMDDLGNRTGNVDLRSGGPEKYEILADDDDNKTNRYTEIDDIAIGYDNAGNLSVDKAGYKYYYDYENRLIEIKNASDVTKAKFYYDALGRRVRKFDSLAGSGVNYYYNDNWQVVAECAVNAQGTETVMLQTEMDKSFENAILLWPFLKGICYGKASQTVRGVREGKYHS